MKLNRRSFMTSVAGVIGLASCAVQLYRYDNH